MVSAMMNQTMQIVTLMVGIAVESVSTQTFVLNVYVMKKLNQKLTILVSYSNTCCEVFKQGIQN